MKELKNWMVEINKNSPDLSYDRIVATMSMLKHLRKLHEDTVHNCEVRHNRALESVKKLFPETKDIIYHNFGGIKFSVNPEVPEGELRAKNGEGNIVGKYHFKELEMPLCIRLTLEEIEPKYNFVIHQHPPLTS